MKIQLSASADMKHLMMLKINSYSKGSPSVNLSNLFEAMRTKNYTCHQLDFLKTVKNPDILYDEIRQLMWEHGSEKNLDDFLTANDWYSFLHVANKYKLPKEKLENELLNLFAEIQENLSLNNDQMVAFVHFKLSEYMGAHY